MWKYPFPQLRKPLDARTECGVYIIYKVNKVLHVGRTPRAKNGIRQRLKDHLNNKSSFTREYLKGKRFLLRKKEEEYAYQYLVVEDDRLRVFLEAYAIGMLCPAHIGLGKVREEKKE